jgi:hypothetical protein
MPRTTKWHDRLFVSDFILPVGIGAYAGERDRLQSVGFNVPLNRPSTVHSSARVGRGATLFSHYEKRLDRALKHMGEVVRARRTAMRFC